jgi:hypothetical protein
MLGAAERRWDNEGQYTWRLCLSVGEDLNPASSPEIICQHFSMLPDHTPPPPSGPASSGSPKATTPTDTCDPSSLPIAPQQPNLTDLDQLATDFNYDVPKVPRENCGRIMYLVFLYQYASDLPQYLKPKRAVDLTDRATAGLRCLRIS